MEIYKKLPLDMVNLILAYDNRFIIRNGKISNRLDNAKYADIREKLLSKHKPSRTYNPDTNYFWAWVTFDKYMIKYYNNEDDINDITYEFRCKISDSISINQSYRVHNKMAIK
jgi:alpha-L-fucosidase